MTGLILMDTAGKRCLLVIHGLVARIPAPHLELIFPAFIARKKTCMSKVYMAEKCLGWVCLIWTLKGHLCGAMGRLLIFTTGKCINQTTFRISIALKLSVYVRTTSTDGMMLIAQSARDLLARKVRFVFSWLVTNTNLQHTVRVHETAAQLYIRCGRAIRAIYLRKFW